MAGTVALRRGLPRVAGGEPWPPAGLAPERAGAPIVAEAADVKPVASAEPEASAESEASAEPVASAEASVAPEPSARASEARSTAPSAPEPVRHGPFTTRQWVGATAVGLVGVLVVAALVVLGTRWLLDLPAMRDFLVAYPGEYRLPDAAPVGIPAWLGWQHFFNVFLMALIVKSGLQVRTERRPKALWAPKRDPKAKIGLPAWFHQSLDVFWLANGVLFVVLLAATGQWMRIVPTSWEVFPNALSAALQYASLDWPTENGWVNYNSLQQLAYFATVFLAAPLAAITGYRMSMWWPKRQGGLARVIPMEWARRVHFPVMLYFVAFTVVHVLLVFATGALRNLNHMYAARGSADPTASADDWTGFWFFAASLVVIVGAVVAARPLVLAPIARLFGTVTAR
ncbi:cytochrome b/b6 domain-containing protein [Agromyces larvae]|uniref:Cytochrome b/b6 domain-containing protein n=1 Tax=Agromyces larvae TaxID=2929802 RepID=A0ABY4BV37_9MICO|nr:cytochrome b/b6 domain-containing protein [Agromyces larvae]UOE43071.1 cytochrome b/b6 domain-containing protein [Agromyces larvae]